MSVSLSATDPDPLAEPPLAATANVENAFAAVFELAIVIFFGLELELVVIDIPDPASNSTVSEVEDAWSVVCPVTEKLAKAYCAVAGVVQDILPKPSVVKTCPLSPSFPFIKSLPDNISNQPVPSILKGAVAAVPNTISVPVAVVPIERLPSETIVLPSKCRL